MRWSAWETTKRTYPVDREREQLEDRRRVLLSLEVLFYLIDVFPLCPVDKVCPVLPLEPERIVEEYHVLVDVYSWAEFLGHDHRPVSTTSMDPINL